MSHHYRHRGALSTAPRKAKCWETSSIRCLFQSWNMTKKPAAIQPRTTPFASARADASSVVCQAPDTRCTRPCKYKGRAVKTSQWLPLTKVLHIDRDGDEYVVRFKSELDGAEGKRTRATSTKVFLAAGCLGTNEIMLRSQEKFDESDGAEGLPLSRMLGRNFSTNGDFFAFSYDLPRSLSATCS